MTNTAELVFVPTPGMGHLPATVRLAKLILQTNERVSISIHIINFPITAAKTDAYVDSQTRDNPFPTRLTFVTLPPLSNTSSPHSFATIIELHKPLIKQAVEDSVKAGLPKPAGFVLDMFCSGMADMAKELNVPSYIFLTSGVSFLNLVLYAQSMADEHGKDVATEFSDPGFLALVPGFKNPVTSEVIPAALQDNKNGGCEMVLSTARNFRETKGILVNTYMELESFGFQTLLNSDDKKTPPVYPVGPILEIDNKSRGGSDNKEKEPVMEWLDGQPKSSVVFLCFGSMGSFDEKQVKEIANGLEKSGHRFLWVLRKPPQEGKPGLPSENETFLEALPKGFLDRTSHKGKIIGWAPQVEILAHPATGGFVSHCGWNSTLESLWFGVPMATWPMYAEQQLNAFELVKELELAVEIRMDYKKDWKSMKTDVIVTAEEIENGITNLMSMDEKMKGRVKKMSDEGKQALEDGGSSYNWLGHFIEDILNNVA